MAEESNKAEQLANELGQVVAGYNEQLDNEEGGDAVRASIQELAVKIADETNEGVIEDEIRDMLTECEIQDQAFIEEFVNTAVQQVVDFQQGAVEE